LCSGAGIGAARARVDGQFATNLRGCAAIAEGRPAKPTQIPKFLRRPEMYYLNTAVENGSVAQYETTIKNNNCLRIAQEIFLELDEAKTIIDGTPSITVTLSPLAWRSHGDIAELIT
jgi:hypothetical protein